MSQAQVLELFQFSKCLLVAPVDFFVEDDLCSGHRHFKLDLCRWSKELLDITVEIFPNHGVHDSPDSLDSAKRSNLLRQWRQALALNCVRIHSCHKLYQIRKAIWHRVRCRTDDPFAQDLLSGFAVSLNVSIVNYDLGKDDLTD